uniref:Uncharacterized protein n=1 Tax=Siphoviridae sp. ctDiR9 TaxID=2825388 RepID=A0A8S5PR28_9CAUD|nr:MAG TPA: hypothetical protein [Siphoviridae sp. ctDiR9]
MPCLYGVWELKIGFYTDFDRDKEKGFGSRILCDC